MANEITVTAGINVVNGNFSHIEQVVAFSFDQATVGGGNPGTITLGFGAEEDIALGDITTLGWCKIKNLDATNFIRIGPKSTVMIPFAKLLPGEFATFPLDPAVTLRGIADAADCLVQILVFER
jgi:hypothetical protein